MLQKLFKKKQKFPSLREKFFGFVVYAVRITLAETDEQSSSTIISREKLDCFKETCTQSFQRFKEMLHSSRLSINFTLVNFTKNDVKRRVEQMIPVRKKN